MHIRLTKVVKTLLIANFAIFIVQQTVDQFFGGNLLYTFALVPSSFIGEFKLWQIFSYAFLHADVMHLFLNLLMLAFLAGDLESAWGSKKFIRFYLFCAVCGGLSYLFMQIFLSDSLNRPMVGASGAVYGILMAYGVLFSERTLLFMLLFPMKAKHFVWILAGIEFMTTVFSPTGGASSVAHLGGLVGGWVYLYGGAFLTVQRKMRAAGKRGKKARSKHLKLVVSNPEEEASGNLEDDDSSHDPKTWH